jgi:hypothetical protein
LDGRRKAVRGEHLVRDLEPLLEADGPAQAVSADLREGLVGNVVALGTETTPAWMSAHAHVGPPQLR